jgi:energy-converting hydrogenase Eha subunit C
MIIVPNDSITITLIVGSGPYQKTLALSLLRVGMLKRVMNSGLYLEMQDPTPDGICESSNGSAGSGTRIAGSGE